MCALYWFHPLCGPPPASSAPRASVPATIWPWSSVPSPATTPTHLLDIVTCVRDHNTPAIALAMAHRREFEGRMLAILNPELRRRGPSRWETASLVGSLALLPCSECRGTGGASLRDRGCPVTASADLGRRRTRHCAPVAHGISSAERCTRADAFACSRGVPADWPASRGDWLASDGNWSAGCLSPVSRRLSQCAGRRARRGPCPYPAHRFQRSCAPSGSLGIAALHPGGCGARRTGRRSGK